MILELVGSRILAPYVGSSIFVWSSLIGIVLASLSLGYFWGGKLADKNPKFETLANILLLAGVAIGLTAIFQKAVLDFLSTNISDIRLTALLSTAILLGPASVCLGFVMPYSVKLKLHSLNKAGETSGRLYALSTIGSIAGTFLAGFWLISVFGSQKILFILSGTMLLLAFISLYIANSKRKIWPLLLIPIMGVGYFLNTSPYFLDSDTYYSRVILEEGVDAESSRPILVLRTGKIRQSAVFTDIDDELVYEYSKYYRLANYFNPHIKNALAIGGGGFSYPKDFLKTNQEAYLDVIEIDPEIISLAKKYFNLKDNPRLSVINEDARVYFNKNEKKYDVITNDAFGPEETMPFQLTTLEAVKEYYDSLNKNGVVIVNSPGVLDGLRGKFLWAHVNTYRQVFPQVLLFPVVDSENKDLRQNIMLVALKNPVALPLQSSDPEISEYLSHLVEPYGPEISPLTDDWAPVEQYNLAVKKWESQ